MVFGACLQDFNSVSESNDVMSSEQQRKIDDQSDEVSMRCLFLFPYERPYLDFFMYYHLACVFAIFGIPLYRLNLIYLIVLYTSNLPTGCINMLLFF